MPKKPARTNLRLLEMVVSAYAEARQLRDVFLRQGGWVLTTDIPGGYQLWAKKVAGRVIAVQADQAYAMEKRWTTEGWGQSHWPDDAAATPPTQTQPVPGRKGAGQHLVQAVDEARQIARGERRAPRVRTPKGRVLKNVTITEAIEETRKDMNEALQKLPKVRARTKKSGSS